MNIREQWREATDRRASGTVSDGRSRSDGRFDYKWVFTFPFRDPRAAIRFVVGSFIAWFPLLNLILLGYAVRTARRAMDGEEHPTPSWRADFWGSVGDSISTCALWFLYWFPGAFVAAAPIAMMAVMFGEGSAVERFLEAVMAVVMVLLLFILLPVVLLQVAASRRLGGVFRPRALLGAMSDNLRATGEMLLVVVPLLAGMMLFFALATAFAPPLYLLAGPLWFYCCLVLGGAVGHAGALMEIGADIPSDDPGGSGGYRAPPPPPPPPPSPTQPLPPSGGRRRLAG